MKRYIALLGVLLIVGCSTSDGGSGVNGGGPTGTASPVINPDLTYSDEGLSPADLKSGYILRFRAGNDQITGRVDCSSGICWAERGSPVPIQLDGDRAILKTNIRPPGKRQNLRITMYEGGRTDTNYRRPMVWQAKLGDTVYH
ncbi:MAG: hypothetical protein AAFR71_16750 [Pseudomonadota bacterium]